MNNITKSKINLSLCKIYFTFGKTLNYVKQIIIAKPL